MKVTQNNTRLTTIERVAVGGRPSSSDGHLGQIVSDDDASIDSHLAAAACYLTLKSMNQKLLDISTDLITAGLSNSKKIDILIGKIIVANDDPEHNLFWRALHIPELGRQRNHGKAVNADRRRANAFIQCFLLKNGGKRELNNLGWLVTKMVNAFYKRYKNFCDAPHTKRLALLKGLSPKFDPTPSVVKGKKGRVGIMRNNKSDYTFIRSALCRRVRYCPYLYDSAVNRSYQDEPVCNDKKKKTKVRLKHWIGQRLRRSGHTHFKDTNVESKWVDELRLAYRSGLKWRQRSQLSRSKRKLARSHDRRARQGNNHQQQQPQQSKQLQRQQQRLPQSRHQQQHNINITDNAKQAKAQTSTPTLQPSAKAGVRRRRVKKKAPPITKIRIATYNVGGLGRNVQYVIDKCEQYRIDVIAITETQTKSKIWIPSGWTFKNSPRDGRRGGGTGLLYRDNLRIQPVNHIKSTKTTGKNGPPEWSSYKLMHGNSSRYDMLTVVYAPPQGPLSTMQSLFTEVNMEMQLHNCRGHILLGDFNVPLWTHYTNFDKKLGRSYLASRVPDHISASGKAKIGQSNQIHKYLRSAGLSHMTSIVNVESPHTKTLISTHYQRNASGGRSYTTLDYIIAVGANLQQRCTNVQVQMTAKDHSIVYCDVEHPRHVTKFVSRPRYARLNNSDPDVKLQRSRNFHSQLETETAAWTADNPIQSPTMSDFAVIMENAARAALGSTTPRKKRGITPQPWWTKELTLLKKGVKRRTNQLRRTRLVDGLAGKVMETAARAKVAEARSIYQKAVRMAVYTYKRNTRENFTCQSSSLHDSFKYMARVKNGPRKPLPYSVKQMTLKWSPIITEDPPPTALLTKCDEKLLKVKIPLWLDKGRHLVTDGDLITEDEVLRGIKDLKRYKASGLDGITNEALLAMVAPPPSASDAPLLRTFEGNGSKKQQQDADPNDNKSSNSLILRLFTACCNELLRDPSTRPVDWNRALVCMIQKVPQPTETEFRPITLLSCVCKLMERIVSNRRAELERRLGPFTADAQCGFANNREVEEAILRLVLAHQRCRQSHKPLYLMFYDQFKAFDSVSYSLMVHRFDQLGLPESLQRYLYYNNTGRVEDGRTANSRRIMGGIHDDVSNTEHDMLPARGAPQGGVLSPLSYNVANDPLIRESNGQVYDDLVDQSRPVRYVPRPDVEVVYNCGYADDTHQGDTSAENLRKRVAEHTQKCVTQSGQKMNGSPKTAAMILGGRDDDHNTRRLQNKEKLDAQLYGETIETVQKYKYLGITISLASLDGGHSPTGLLDNSNRLEQLKKTIASSRSVWCATSGTSVRVGSMLARPVVYGLAGFGIVVMPANWKKIDVLLGLAAKSVLSCYDCATTTGALAFLGWQKAQLFASIRTVTFVMRLATHPVKHMASAFINLLIGDSELRGWPTHVKQCCQHLSKMREDIGFEHPVGNTLDFDEKGVPPAVWWITISAEQVAEQTYHVPPAHHDLHQALISILTELQKPPSQPTNAAAGAPNGVNNQPQSELSSQPTIADGDQLNDDDLDLCDMSQAGRRQLVKRWCEDLKTEFRLKPHASVLHSNFAHISFMFYHYESFNPRGKRYHRDCYICKKSPDDASGGGADGYDTPEHLATECDGHHAITAVIEALATSLCYRFRDTGRLFATDASRRSEIANVLLTLDPVADGTLTELSADDWQDIATCHKKLYAIRSAFYHHCEKGGDDAAPIAQLIGVPAMSRRLRRLKAARYYNRVDEAEKGKYTSFNQLNVR
jgi:hypothetical protein